MSSKRGKTYRGQRVQKSYKKGCGCFFCTGTNKEDRRMMEEKRIDKETREEAIKLLGGWKVNNHKRILLADELYKMLNKKKK